MERIPVSFPLTTLNMFIRMFYAPPAIMQLAFFLCSFLQLLWVCRVDSYQRINLARAVWEFNASECVYVRVITTNPKRATFNKFRRCNRFPLSKVDPLFIDYGRNSVDQNLASKSGKKVNLKLPYLGDYSFSLAISRLQFSCERPLSKSADFICLSCRIKKFRTYNLRCA